MYTLDVDEALLAVRKNLDELDPNESMMYVPAGGDNASLDETIRRTLPEAINAVHAAAPVQLLEGRTDILYTDCPFDDDRKVLEVIFPEPLLRLVAFQAKDSEKVVTDVVPEASPEGHKQLNKYLRGRHDRPVLVELQGSHGRSHLYYYSLAEAVPVGDSSQERVKQCLWIPQYMYAAANTSYDVSTALRDRIIDHLTGMVLAIFGETEKANYFITKASFNPAQ